MNNEAFSSFFAASSKRKENSEKHHRQSKKISLLPEDTNETETMILEETIQCRESVGKVEPSSEVNMNCTSFQRASTTRIGESKTLEKKWKILPSSQNENQSKIKVMERNEQIITEDNIEVSKSDKIKTRNVMQIQKTDNSICVKNSELSKFTLKEELVRIEGDENNLSFNKKTIKNENKFNVGKHLEQDNEIPRHSTDDVVSELLRRNSRTLLMQMMNDTGSKDYTSYNIPDKATVQCSELNLVENLKKINKGNENMTFMGDNATSSRKVKLVRGSQTFRYNSNLTQSIKDHSRIVSDKSEKKNCIDEIAFIDDDNEESKYFDNNTTAANETSVSSHISYYNQFKENITLRRETSDYNEQTSEGYSNDNKRDVCGLESFNEQSSSDLKLEPKKKSIKLKPEESEKFVNDSESTKNAVEVNKPRLDSTVADVEGVRTTKGFNWFKSKRNVTKNVHDDSTIEQIQHKHDLKKETSNCQENNNKAIETILTNIDIDKCSEPQYVFIATGVRPLVIRRRKHLLKDSHDKFPDKNISQSGENYSSLQALDPNYASTCDSGMLDTLSSDGNPLKLSAATNLLRQSNDMNHADKDKMTSNKNDPVNTQIHFFCDLEKTNLSNIDNNDNNKTIENEQNSLKSGTLKSFDSFQSNVVFDSRKYLKGSELSKVCGKIDEPNSYTFDQTIVPIVEIQAASILLPNSVDNSNLDTKELTLVLSKENVSDLETTQNLIESQKIDRSVQKTLLSRSDSVCSNDSFRSVSSISSQSSDISYKSVVGEKVCLNQNVSVISDINTKTSNELLLSNIELSKSNNNSSIPVNELSKSNNDSSKSLSDTDTSQISTYTSTKSKSRKKTMKFSVKSSKTLSLPKKNKLLVDANNDVPKENIKIGSPTTPEPMTVFMATCGVRPVLSFRKLKLFDTKSPSDTQHSKEKEKGESSSPQLCFQQPLQDASDQGSLPSTPCSEKDRIEMMAAGGREEVSQELVATPISSKARQKKFHRHFKTVAPDEPVLNYYSCALVADILLQGHLYITKNYFAFYSNVFGYVTKLLIPTATVVKVTKEKTAYIIPNAVGITTEEDKHVFGSLLSRDNTYKLMVQVWSAAVKQSPTHLPLVPVNKQTINEGDEATKEELEDCTDLPVLNDDESSVSGSESNLGAKLRRPLSASKANQTLNVETKSYQDVFSQTVPPKGICAHYFTYLSSVPRPTLLLVFSTVLLILLFTSAAVLLFRISRLQEGYSNSHFTTRSISEVQEFLNSNLEQISKVRQSLETLSLLIEGNTENAVGKQRWNSFSNADNNYQHNS